MANSRDTIISYVYDITGDQDLANTAGLLVKMADSSKLADTEAIALASSLKTLSTQSKAVNDALSQKAGLGETTNQLKDAQAALAKYRAETDTTVTSSKKYQTALAAAESSVASLTTKQNLQQVALTKTLGGLEKAGVDTTNLAAASEKLGSQAATVASSLAKVGTAATAASTSTSKIGAAADVVRDSFVHVTEGVGEFIKKAGEITGIAGIIGGVVAALSGFKFFEVGAEEAAHFDDALGKLKASSNLTAEEFENLKERIEAASTAVDETATDGAIAAGKLAAAFGDANKAVEALPATLELAKAAQIGVAQAADIVSTSIKAFGLEVGDAGKVADTLATVAVKTGQNLGGLSAVFSQLAPFAKAVGLSFTDVASILGVLAQKGIDSEGALGGLRGLFEALRNPTSELRQQLVGLGVDTSSFQTIIAGLANAGPRAEAALDSLGTKGKAAILALVQDGGAGLLAFQKNLSNVAGAAGQLGEKVEDTLLGSFKDFGANLSNLAGGVLSKALDPIKAAVQSLTTQIKGIPDSAGFKAIQAAIGDFAQSAADSFTTLIRSINFDEVGKSVAAFVTDAKKNLGELGDSVRSFGSAASTVANTIGAVFHTLESAIFLIASAFDESIKDILKGATAVTGVLGGTTEQLTKLNDLTEAFGSAAVTNWNRAAAAIKAAGGNFDAITGQLDKLDESSAKASDSAGKAGESLGKTATAADQFASSLTKAGDAATAASLNIGGITKSLEPAPILFTDIGRAADDGLAKVADGLTKIGPSADQLRAQITQVAFQLGELQGTEKDGGTEAEALKQKLIELDVALANLGTQKAAANVNDLKTAFTKLKVSSQADLEDAADAAHKSFDLIDKGSADTAAGLADRQNAFIAYAKAALDAAANIDQAHVDSTQIELESKASALGLSEALEKVKKSGTDAGKQTSEAFRSVPSDIQAATDAVDHVGQFSDTASRAIKQMGEETGDALDNVTADLSNFSQNAIRAFAEAQDAALQFGIHSSADLASYVRSIDSANAKINDSIALQKTNAQTLIDSFSNLTDAQLKTLAGSGNGIDALNAELQDLIASAKSGSGEFALLNDSDLSRVIQAAESAAQRVEQISEAAKQARADLANIGDDLQDQIDQINGNQTDIEDRRFQNQLEQLREEAEANGLLNSAEYADAVSKANQLHALKLKQIQDEANAQKKANDDVNNSNPSNPSSPSGSGSGSSSGGGSSASGGASAPGATRGSQGAQAINVQITSTVFDDRTLEDVARKLVKKINTLGGFKF